MGAQRIYRNSALESAIDIAYYREVAEVGITEANALPTIAVAPNPAVDRYVCTVSGMRPTGYVLQDALGRTIRSGVLNGSDKMELDVLGLAAGTYVLRVQAPSGREAVQRMMVQR